MRAKIFFNLTFGLFISACFISIAVGQQANTPATPVISSVSPSHVAVGTQMTITGSGLMSNADLVIIDGDFRSGYVKPLSDTTLKYKLATYVYNKNACHEFLKEHPRGHCDPRPFDIKPGTHTISIENENGASNASAFTVIPFQGQVSIDSNFVVLSSGNPTVSGTGNGVSSIWLRFKIDGHMDYYAGPTAVTNGHWTVQLNSANNNPSCVKLNGLETCKPYNSSFKDIGPLSSGTIGLEISDDNTGLTLYSGNLTVKK